MVKLQYGFLCLGYFVTGRYGTTIQDTANLTELAYSRLKVNNPQQAAADGLSELGIQATLVVHFPSRINAPEGILLTTYDQLHTQIAKNETTVYAFPSFGAAQSVMRALYAEQRTAIFVFECHAHTGPVEIAAKIFRHVQQTYSCCKRNQTTHGGHQIPKVPYCFVLGHHELL